MPTHATFQFTTSIRTLSMLRLIIMAHMDDALWKKPYTHLCAAVEELENSLLESLQSLEPNDTLGAIQLLETFAFAKIHCYERAIFSALAPAVIAPDIAELCLTPRHPAPSDIWTSVPRLQPAIVIERNDFTQAFNQIHNTNMNPVYDNTQYCSPDQVAQYVAEILKF